MIQKTMVVGPFQCNCRLFVCPSSGEALLVDPGDEAEKILSQIQKVALPGGKKVSVKYLLHTHGHLDHIGATGEVKKTLLKNQSHPLSSTSAGASASLAAPVSLIPQIALHRGDEMLYQSLKMQGGLFGLQYDEPLPIDHYLEDGEMLHVGSLKFSILHTPGHSPGSVCIRLHEDQALGAQELLLSGDTLFQGSVGRTDLWGANQEQMFQSIHRRILTLDEDTRVCPGHGLDTFIGIEKRENPFLS